MTEWEGTHLDLNKVSRYDMAAYLCIASNGVPPTVSKRITLSVECKFISPKNHFVRASERAAVVVEEMKELRVYICCAHYWKSARLLLGSDNDVIKDFLNGYEYQS